MIDLMSRSIQVIRENQSPSGAYPACPTFSAYAGYAWLRDGAFIAEGMSRAGEEASVTAFHEWCARVVSARAAQVDDLIGRRHDETLSPGEMLPTRFTLDGADGTDEWWDHQLDGYGTWLWQLAEHVRRYDTPVHLDAVRVAARYLSAFWDSPCYDWWEEHVDQRHVATLGAIHAGLRAAISLGAANPEIKEAIGGIEALIAAEGVAEKGHLRKWLGSDEVDASLLACVAPFGVYAPDHPVAVATVAEVERQLAHEGGVYRYRADTFYGGGRWVLLAGFLGLNHAAAGRPDEARRYLDWMAAQALTNGDLPEQVSDVLLFPDRHDEWLRRWGTVATPLLWSHGMYLMLGAEL